MKRWLTVVLIVCLAALQTKAYLHAGIPYTHDGENHLARFANYKIAVREGQIPPRFAPNLLNHHGYPVLNYNYPLANILSLPLSLAKVSYLFSFKMIVITFVVAGLLGVWALATKWRVTWKATWIALAVYGLSPYVSNAILYRGSIGEIMALGLLPWVLWAIEVLLTSTTRLKPLHFVFTTGILISFLLAHNVSVLISVPLLAGYVAVRWLNDKRLNLKALIASSAVAVASVLWFWLPLLAEKSLIQIDRAASSMDYIQHFPTLSQLLFSGLGFGFSNVGFVDSLGFNVGLTQLFSWIISGLVMTVCSWLWLAKRLTVTKEEKTWLLIAGGAAFMSIVLMGLQLEVSSPFWQLVSMLRFIQFPWRLTLFWTVLVTVMALLTAGMWPKWAKLVFIVFVGMQVIYIWRLQPVDYRYLTNVDLDAYTLSTTTQEENLPNTFWYDQVSTDWQPTATIAEGEGAVEVNYWQGSRRQYRLLLNSPAMIVEPTMHFAGWQTWVTKEDGSSESVEHVFNDINKGLIAYKLPAGSYEVESRFTQGTWPRVVGNTVSVVAMMGLIAWAGWSLKKERRDQK